MTKRKKELHEKIGIAIEGLYKESIAEYYGVLYEHFVQSENYEKSIEYSKMAGWVARKRNALMDAIYYAKKSIYCFERLPQTDAIQRKLIDARTTLSNYYISLNYHTEAMEAVTPIVNLTKKIGYEKRLPRILTAIGSYSLVVEEDFPKGIEELKKAIELSEKTGDFLSLWNAYYFLAVALSLECEFENGLHYFKKALDLSVSANDITGISFVKNTLAAWNYAFQGKINLALETTKEALNLTEESNDIYIKGTTYPCYGSVCYFKGLLDAGESNLLKGMDLCEKISHFSWAGWAALYLGNIYCERGDYEKARNYFEKCILFLGKGKLVHSWARSAKIYVEKTKRKQSYSKIDLKQLYNCAYENRIKIIDGWTSRSLCEILMDMDDVPKSEAEDWIKRAIELDGKRGLRWQLAMDHAVYSDLYIKNGDPVKAKENLCKAVDIFKECGADGWVEKTEKKLAAL